MAGKKEKDFKLEIPQNLDGAEKQKALNNTLKQLGKDFGEGIVMRLGDQTVQHVDVIHSGSLSLDLALGVGGVPRGRITEIYGSESSGKTTLALHVIAEAQKAGGTAAFIDAEHALDPVYAKAIGVDVTNLLISQPDCGEDALEICDQLARSGAVDCIVIDSVAALTPKNEVEGVMGTQTVGLQARMMSQAMRKLAAVVSKSNCCVIFINQVREKVGVMYGNPETTPGGRALKFFASVRMEVRRKEFLSGENKTRYGILVSVNVVKNKVAPPFRTAEFELIYGEGISVKSEIIGYAVQADIVKKSGSWFSYKGERIGQGMEKVKEYLKENPDVLNAITDEVMVAIQKGTIQKDETFGNASEGADGDDELSSDGLLDEE